MEAKEKRKLVADIAVEQEAIDSGIDMINELLTRIVDDNVTSDTAQMLFIFNPQENVWIANSAPLVLGQPPALEGEESPPLQMIGMNMQFADHMLFDETLSTSFPLSHKMLIRMLTLLKTDMGREQKQLDRKMAKLMK